VFFCSAFSDSGCHSSSTPEQLDRVVSTGDQATGADEASLIKARGQFIPRRERDDPITVNERRYTPWHNQLSIRGAGEDS
jgi:hypothetical protein